jgi:predicted aldo/keto reductase-like oxidoreductase
MKIQKVNRSRRNFLKCGLTGAASAFIFPEINKQNNLLHDRKIKDKIIYRTLGKTGLKIPVVGFGGPHNPGLINSALEKGIIHFNTSPDYLRGNQETMIGNTLKNVSRDSFLIATGFSMWRKPQHQLNNYNKKMIKESLDASLRRLKLDYVDIYYLLGAAGRETVLHSPFIEIMESFKRDGKVRYIGITAHQNEPEVLYAATESKVYDVVLTAYNFRKIYRDDTKKAIAKAAKAGLGIIAMKTQAGVYWDHKTKEKINMKAALKWVLQDKNVHTAVPEFASYQEMNEGLSVMENLELSSEERKDLRLDDRTSRSGLYCQNCEKCVPQCKGNFDIPVIMRSYMYAYGYRNTVKAKETINHLDFSNINCENCSECSVKCSMGFNVREKILDIIRIKNVPEEFLV